MALMGHHRTQHFPRSIDLLHRLRELRQSKTQFQLLPGVFFCAAVVIIQAPKYLIEHLHSCHAVLPDNTFSNMTLM